MLFRSRRKKNSKKRKLQFQTPAPAPALNQLQSKNAKQPRKNPSTKINTKPTPPATQKTANPPKTTKTHHHTNPQNPNRHPPTPPFIFPNINKVFIFKPKGPKPIQNYEAWLDEYQTASIWDRPVKNYHTDTPFYP